MGDAVQLGTLSLAGRPAALTWVGGRFFADGREVPPVRVHSWSEAGLISWSSADIGVWFTGNYALMDGTLAGVSGPPPDAGADGVRLGRVRISSIVPGSATAFLLAALGFAATAVLLWMRGASAPDMGGIVYSLGAMPFALGAVIAVVIGLVLLARG